MPVSSYSTTADSNTAYMPEGQSWPSVNNGVRAIQADIAAAYRDAGWCDYGTGTGAGTTAANTYAYVTATQFRVAGDVTAAYYVGRAVRAVGSTTGTIYGIITASSYSAPNTTVTVRWHAGQLANETFSIALSNAAGGYASSLQSRRLDLSNAMGAYLLADSETRILFGCGGNETLRLTHGVAEVRFTSTGDVGAKLTLRHNSSNPAVSDEIGQIAFVGKSDTLGNDFTFGTIQCIADELNGSSSRGRYEVNGGQWRVTVDNDAPLRLIRTSYVSGNASVAEFWANTTQRGRLVINGNTVALQDTSDERLKDKITPLTGALEAIAQTPVWRFRWKEGGDEDLGVMAQDVQKFAPHLVSESTDGRLLLNKTGLVFWLWSAVQNLTARLEALETRNG